MLQSLYLLAGDMENFLRKEFTNFVTKKGLLIYTSFSNKYTKGTELFLYIHKKSSTMLLSNKIKVKISTKNKSYLESVGYTNIEMRSVVEIDIKHLSKGSHAKVKVQCDVCGSQRDLMYKEYVRNCKKYGYYSCQGKCSSSKMKKTCLDKYGVEYASQSSVAKEKLRKTCLDRYGVEYATQSDFFKNKLRQTYLDKYGYDNPSKCDDFKSKRKMTMLERYGVEYYVLSEEFKEKSEKTSLINYGFTHPMKNRNQVAKMLKKLGLEFQTNEYRIYQNKVYNLTKKNKEELLKKWDGFDFYDGEYIKNNFELDPLSSDYPTIDHKLCIFEGYKNNLDPSELSKIENLCLTKRRINSSKKNKKNWSI